MRRPGFLLSSAVIIIKGSQGKHQVSQMTIIIFSSI
jgi:hypothetical protein